MTHRNSSTSLEKDLALKIAEAAPGGRIDCELARRIAEEAGVAYVEVGRIANKLNIKIRNCGLGCF